MFVTVCSSCAGATVRAPQQVLVALQPSQACTLICPRRHCCVFNSGCQPQTTCCWAAGCVIGPNKYMSRCTVRAWAGQQKHCNLSGGPRPQDARPGPRPRPLLSHRPLLTSASTPRVPPRLLARCPHCRSRFYIFGAAPSPLPLELASSRCPQTPSIHSKPRAWGASADREYHTNTVRKLHCGRGLD